MKRSREKEEMYDRVYNRARYRHFYEFGKRMVIYKGGDKDEYEIFMSAAEFTKCEADFYKKYIEERLGPCVRGK